ncbi:MAG: GNAT family N-acetyltransferase [archaeon]|nr:GNAT family N-acetyltransferase [archaeon]
MFTIREFQTEDAAIVYSIMKKSLDQYYDPYMLHYFHNEWSGGQLVACDVLGTPIGALMSTKINNRRARIMMLAIEPVYRNRGIGHMLLDKFRFKALMEGIIRITLEVRFENIKARRFYIKNGFSETAILNGYYQDKGKGVRMDGPVQLNI